MSELITNKKDLRKAIDALVDLYFAQPKVLYSHLFSSYHQFIEEMIPYSLEEETNYFYDSVTPDAIYFYGFKFKNTKILPPVRERDNEIIYPHMARKNYLNYFSNIHSTVTQFQEKIDLITGERTFKNIGNPEEVVVASVPIMVKSKYCSTHLKPQTSKYECKYDPGGYFIVGGQEKAIVTIEKMIDNKVLVFGKADSTFPIGKSYTAQINSRKHDWSENLQIITIKNNKDNSLIMTTSQLVDIPIMVLLRALGIENDKELIARITNDLNDVPMVNLLRESLDNSTDEEGNKITTREQALEFLMGKMKAGRRISQSDENVAKAQKKILLDKILTKDFLPHLGSDIQLKASFICMMIKKLLLVMLKRTPEDDRDTFENKRLETPGVLLGQLFRQNFNKMLKEIGKLFRRKNNSDETPINIISQINSTTIEQGLKSGLATGIWGLSKTKAGVAQSLTRLTWLQTISLLRRIKTPTMDTSTAKIASIRQVNNIQAFFVCNVETPEGMQVGLTQSLSIMASVSPRLESQTNLIRDIIEKHPKIEKPYLVNPENLNNMVKIFHNGAWLGVLEVNDGLSFYNNLRDMRKEGKINKFVTITLDYFEKIIYIYTEAGRLIRPLLHVDDNQVKITKKMYQDFKNEMKEKNKSTGWNKILLKYPDLVDYEDIEASRNLMIAMDLDSLFKNRQNQLEKVNNKEEIIKPNRYGKFRFVRYTHSEFHPVMMLGSISSTVPFINHDPTSRSIIFFSQAKQAVGLFSTAYKDRMDLSNVLYHPQTPLVITKPAIYNRFNDMPSGENIVVAVMSYKGYNVEDSIIINQSSLDRGLFRADTLRKYSSKIEKNPSSSQDDIFTKPDRNKVSGMSRGNYEKLNDKGFIPEETPITNKDVLIGKVSPIQPTGDNKVFKDKSELFKSNVDGVVDRVHSNIFNNDGYEMISMRIRMERPPIIGDKFCLTPDHQVLTTEGWKNINRISTNDYVACLDDKQNIYYSQPTDVFCFEYQGKMLKINHPNVNLVTTMEHKMYCKKLNKDNFDFILAKDVINNTLTYKNNGLWNKPVINECYFLDKKIKTSLYLEFLGLFVKYGSIDKYHSFVSFNLVNDKIDKQFHMLLNQLPYLGIPIYVNKDVKFNNKKLYQYFNTQNSLFESWVYNLNSEQIKIIINVLFDDGTFSTTNKIFADQISLLTLNSGLSTNMKIIGNKYILELNQQLEPTIFHDKCCSQINYSGKVYCLQVPHHIFYVRRKGIPVWTGNSTRHGQKGTTGITLAQRDMPFTPEGIIPDIIFNPHGYPTRQTAGQLIETLASKVAANTGELFDGTSMSDYDVTEIPEILKKLGMDEYGTEEMYCGMTGKKMKVRIFIGPMFYLRLKHMVLDKVHSRNTGPRQAITRQPMEGRTKDGGLKIGEMEKDAMVAHGVGQFLKEVMMEKSDITSTVVCDKCGIFATKVMDKDYYVCNNCNNHTEFSNVAMPYAFKLMVQELTAVNILPRIKADKYDT